MKTIAFFALAIGCVLAQVQEYGIPYSLANPEKMRTVNFERLPVPDVESAIAEDLAAPKDVPFRFGLEVAVNQENQGVWEKTSHGHVWRYSLYAPGAVTIGVVFDEFHIPEEGQLFIYNQARDHILGAFTKMNNKPDRRLVVRPVKGDAITIEYNQPAHITEKPFLHVSNIVYGYRSIYDRRVSFSGVRNFNDSGSCNINVQCEFGKDWTDEIRSVAMILTGSGMRACTGALINNAEKDKRQLFLTANHCYHGSVSDWVFMFNYESPSCSPNTDGKTDMTVAGANLLAKHQQSDFLLLEIVEKIPSSYNVYFAGWSADDVAPKHPVGIHHPSGDVKKISHFEDICESDSYLGKPEGLKDSHWHVAGWNLGTTEPGSSGSPLFSHEKHIVGQLHGGYASCNNESSDWYGKLSMSFDALEKESEQLKIHLDPKNSGIRKMGGINHN